MKRGGGVNVVRGDVDGVVAEREGVVPPDMRDDCGSDISALFLSTTRKVSNLSRFQYGCKLYSESISVNTYSQHFPARTKAGTVLSHGRYNSFEP